MLYRAVVEKLVCFFVINYTITITKCQLLSFVPKKDIDHLLMWQLLVHFYLLTCVFVDLKFIKRFERRTSVGKTLSHCT